MNENYAIEKFLSVDSTDLRIPFPVYSVSLCLCGDVFSNDYTWRSARAASTLQSTH
jgi:hypothetical protein